MEDEKETIILNGKRRDVICPVVSEHRWKYSKFASCLCVCVWTNENRRNKSKGARTNFLEIFRKIQQVLGRQHTQLAKEWKGFQSKYTTQSMVRFD